MRITVEHNRLFSGFSSAKLKFLRFPDCIPRWPLKTESGIILGGEVDTGSNSRSVWLLLVSLGTEVCNSTARLCLDFFFLFSFSHSFTLCVYRLFSSRLQPDRLPVYFPIWIIKTLRIINRYFVLKKAMKCWINFVTCQGERERKRYFFEARTAFHAF